MATYHSRIRKRNRGKRPYQQNDPHYLQDQRYTSPLNYIRVGHDIVDCLVNSILFGHYHNECRKAILSTDELFKAPVYQETPLLNQC